MASSTMPFDPIINKESLYFTTKLEEAASLRVQVRHSILKLQRYMITLVYAIAIGIATWVITSMVKIEHAYREFIESINMAISKGQYTGPGGLRTAFAYYWGRLGAFCMGFSTWHLPASLVTMFYSKQWRTVFDNSSGYKGGAIGNWYECVRRISKENRDMQVMSVLCTALDCTRGPSYGCPQAMFCRQGAINAIACLPQCDPTAFVQMNGGATVGMEAAQGAVSGAASGAMIGSMFGPVGEVIGGIGGLVFGGVFSTYTAVEQSQGVKKQCLAARENCVMPEGATKCGGCVSSGFLGMGISCEEL